MRELFRLNLLRQLAAAASHGLSIPQLKVGLAHDGLPEGNDDVLRAELAYLMDKGLVAVAQKLLSPENKSWRITASGRDFLAEQGLA